MALIPITISISSHEMMHLLEFNLMLTQTTENYILMPMDCFCLQTKELHLRLIAPGGLVAPP